jgi:hypothetical protein
MMNQELPRSSEDGMGLMEKLLGPYSCEIHDWCVGLDAALNIRVY